MRMGELAYMWKHYGLYWPTGLAALILLVCLYDALFR